MRGQMTARYATFEEFKASADEALAQAHRDRVNQLANPTGANTAAREKAARGNAVDMTAALQDFIKELRNGGSIEEATQRGWARHYVIHLIEKELAERKELASYTGQPLRRSGMNLASKHQSKSL